MQLIVKNAKLRDRETLTDIAIDQGVILEIGPNLSYPADTVIDAKGALVTPSLIDPHIHLDKVNIFDVVRKNVSGTLKEAIEIIWDKKKDYTTRYPRAIGMYSCAR
jgi:cytosine deaminase